MHSSPKIEFTVAIKTPHQVKSISECVIVALVAADMPPPSPHISPLAKYKLGRSLYYEIKVSLRYNIQI